ncbi:MAG: lysostaphin resistance A-like protein [Ruminococcus callidus]
MNTLVAWLGCRRIRQPLGGLFRTTDFSGWKAFQYICIGCIAAAFRGAVRGDKAAASGTAGSIFRLFQSTQSMLLALLYTCVLAPVTEELLFRGFLMKSLSAVSVRFGIVTSALLFGLMHGNFQQFILGFVMGLFLGKIVARHNSLLPSILVHMAVNTNSMVLSLLQEKLPEKVANVGILPFGMAVLAFSIMGVLFWLLYERRQPLPYPTQKQATRSRTAMFSPALVLAVVVLAGFMVFLAVRGANG